MEDSKALTSLATQSLPEDQAPGSFRAKASKILDVEEAVAFPDPAHQQPNSKHSSYSSVESLDESKAPPPLPPKRLPRILRHARHTFGNVYRRLFSIVFVANMIGLGILLHKSSGNYSSPQLLSNLATGASANILLALAARIDYMVNLFFEVAWRVPINAPLRLRCMLAKVYEYGGVHSGAACACVVWFGCFLGFLSKDFAASNGPLRKPAVLALTYILFVVLLSLCITAYPKLRFSSHNTFERVHRWGGWFTLGVFWIELILFANAVRGEMKLGTALIKLPTFWFLIIASAHLFYPWVLSRKLHVRAEKLSDHATRLHFDYPIAPFHGLRISRSPIKEWHAFAVIPAPPGVPGGSMIISNNGDWTKDTIQNPRPYYWIKGIPATGVLAMSRIFKKIVVVTTGSGIGPVLAVIQDPIMAGKVRVIWSTPNPLQTYGSEILDAVTTIDNRAVIINTREPGQKRPDLVAKAWELYSREQGVEAVFVISNPKLTRKVVYGLESRGVPCFGPIWDS